MRGYRRRDTLPECSLRSELHRQGLRFRANVKPIASSRCVADILFQRRKIAVFVDGCFWHGCPSHMTWPKSNARFWRDKIEANRRRDRLVDRMLTSAGWRVLRCWEHEPAARAAVRIARVWRQRAP